MHTGLLMIFTGNINSFQVEKTVWDWQLMNESKPIWTKKTDEVTEEEYEEFFKSLTNSHAKIFHFTLQYWATV